MEKVLYGSQADDVYSFDLMIALAKQILEGLSYVHSQKKMHLDLKPDNVLLATQGNKLVAKVRLFQSNRMVQSNCM